MPKDRSKDLVSQSDDIAIIGMSCVFPAADGLAAYWSNIVGAVDAIGEPSPGWDAARYLGAGVISTSSGGFLKDLFRFDAAELGVMPSSIDGSEPDQFLALRVAREALIDAGYHDDAYDHTATGIILGHSTYLHRGNANVVQHGLVIDQTVGLLRQLFPALGDDAASGIGAALRAHLPPFNSDIAPGLVPNVMTGRIANRLNLRGPNYIIDAACASSLLAVGAAVEELRTGRSDLMLAGSVNASLPPEVYMVFNQLGALSRRAKVRPFSDLADGTLLGEGLGVVVLKRLADARSDGDRIYAVVKAVGQSSDGKGLGLLAPNPEGEALAIRRTYAQAGIAPQSVGLIEAHGTGIPLGDRTEISALRSVLGGRGELPDCAIGSIKSMIGHCIPAAGVAGLIKTALALHYRVLPPTLCDEVNPALALETTPLYVNTEARPWIQGSATPRRAAVNAFGFGGINSHALLEEAATVDAPPRPALWPSELAVFAGQTAVAVIDRLDALVRAHAAGQFAEVTLAALAMGLAERAGDGRFRVAIVASDLGDLVSKAAKAAARLREAPGKRLQSRAGIFYAPDRTEGDLAFVFPGEGAQYQGMLADILMCFPEARAWFDFWDGVFDEAAGGRRSPCVFPPPTTLDAATEAALKARLFGLEVGSESMFIASQALLAVLADLRLKPDAVVGHSSGENSALLAAGAFECRDWDELGRHIRKLNQVYNEIEGAQHTEGGALLTVGAVARERLLALADGVTIHLALDNCQHQSVLYGARGTMEGLARELGKEGGLCAFLPFDRPYHTPLFATTAQAIEGIYDDMRFQAPVWPVYSCTTTERLPDDPAELRRIALAQWSSRVRFTETIERMYADGTRFFVEVGPSSNLTGFIDDILRGKDYLAVSLDSQRRSSLAQLLTALARLWVRGRDFSLAALFARRGLSAADPDGAGNRPSRKRAYPNTLPYVRLSEAEIASLRTALCAAEGAAERPAAAVPQAAPAQPAEIGVAGAADDDELVAAGHGAPAAAERDEVISGHFALMRAFLSSQERVMAGVLGLGELDDAAGEGGGAVDRGLPFVQQILEQDEDRVVAACEVSVANDAFLLHHVLYTVDVSDLDPALHGLAVVPLSVSMEMVAEVASLLARQPVLSRLEDVRAHDWMALDTGSRTLTLSAERRAVADGDADGEDRIAVVISDGPARLFEADVVFTAAPAALAPSLPPLTAPRPPVWRDEDLYTSGMFHGPLFQSVAGLGSWDEAGLDVTLRDTPLDGFFGPGGRPALLLNPVLLDAIGHVTAFWIAQHMGTDFSSFPSRIARIELADAWREDTGGAALGGRMSFDADEQGQARYLAGDYECVAADGTVLFRVTGWQDRFFDVPGRFFFARFRPREGWYGDECTALFGAVPEGALVWSVPAFPPRFLDDAGGIWKRVLAHTVLSRQERADWEGLSPNPKRRTDWLMGRVALKEAVRGWIALHHGALLLPADIEIGVGAGGKPYVAEEGLEAFAPLPQVSVAHAAGAAVAIAAPFDTPVGIDVEPVGRVIKQDVLTGAFTADEQSLLAGGSEGTLLRAWCAKEAAAKCLGEGLNGRPQAFALSRFSAQHTTEPARVSAFGHDIDVVFAEHGEAVLAIAVDRMVG